MQSIINFFTSLKVFDVIYLAFLIFFFIRGYMRGLIGTLLSYIFFTLKFIISYLLSSTIASFLAKTQLVETILPKMNIEIANWIYQLIAFLIILIILSIIFKSIIHQTKDMFKSEILGQTNKIMGALFSTVLFIVLTIIFYYLLLSNVFTFFKQQVPDSFILQFFEWIMYR